MKNKIYILGFALVISFVSADCGGNNSRQQGFPPTAVTAYTVSKHEASYYVNYPATVTALNQVEIRPEVSGYLTGIYFKDGQHVTKGMKLYAIDQQQYKASYDAAKANLEKAQEDYNSYNYLAQNNAVATQTLEHAKADLMAAKSNLSEVETNLRNSIIKAPFDGTIGISQVKLGSAITVGQTLMNTISSDNPIAVDLQIDQTQIERFNSLLHKKSSTKDSTFTLVLPDQTIYKYPGHLLLLDRAVDPETGTITARLEFPNDNDDLRPGMTCDVRVLSNEGKAILIPYKAVVEQMGEYFVYVIVGKKVSQRRIDIGRSIGDMVIVKTGLNDGEEIVTQGVQKLRDNSPITLGTPNK
jgi:RND family efflux transporter MFP subunit